MIKIQEQNAVQVNQKTARLFALDALRGLIIILMALDHANHFIAQKHSAGEYWGGQFPLYDDPIAFLTRLVTHPVAPGFALLMGIGIALFARSRRKRGWGQGAIIRHLIIRGVVLMFLQLAVVNRAWELSPGGWGLDVYFGVLFALGGGMILGSLLVWLKPKYLFALALVVFVGAELLTPSPDQWGENFPLLINVLLIPGGKNGWWVNYPILQWVELVVFGLAFGQWLAEDVEKGLRQSWKFGAVFLLAFMLLRYLDGFGNIRPRMGDTWIDFFNVVKYPPSMTFTLLTTGFNLIILWLFTQIREKWRIIFEPLAVFGRAPLFFYVLHLFLYAGIGNLLTSGGMSIPAMYPFWLLGLLILFPLCLLYGRFKHRQPPNSIWRFF